MRAVGRTRSGRYVFLVFMLRNAHGGALIRPISARYMDSKETAHYEATSSK